jgi:hypothetical protein
MQKAAPEGRLFEVVGMTGFEPATPTSRTWYATNCATSRSQFWGHKDK